MVIIELLVPKNRTYTYDSGENINSLTEILSFHTAWHASIHDCMDAVGRATQEAKAEFINAPR